MLGQKADPEVDRVEVDGRVLAARREFLYYLMNKPKGVVTTNATRSDQRTVADLLPAQLKGKIFPIGRLDKDSSGLLILTNDGVLAYHLTHPKFEHEKEYEVIVERPITDGALRKMEKGITLSGVKTKQAKVKRLGQEKFLIALTEGKNRQIRRMCQKVGCPVRELRRVRIVTLTDSSISPGSLRVLRSQEVKTLLSAIGVMGAELSVENQRAVHRIEQH
jgi:pseudouridine synthase